MFGLLLRRSLATEASAATNRLRLSLVAPHQTFIKDQPVEQVNVSTTEGSLGILAGHVPVILQLKPGLVEVFAEAKKTSYFGNECSPLNEFSQWRVCHRQSRLDHATNGHGVCTGGTARSQCRPKRVQ